MAFGGYPEIMVRLHSENHGWPAIHLVQGLLDFLLERLVIQLRAEGARHDALMAVFGSKQMLAGQDDDILDLLARAEAVAQMLSSENGTNLLQGYRRASNILRSGGRRHEIDRPGNIDDSLLVLSEERSLAQAASTRGAKIGPYLKSAAYGDAISELAQLREPIDAFFDKVTVNADDPALRDNRLNLLASVVRQMNAVADFSKIEG